jgi:hypothetical protein
VNDLPATGAESLAVQRHVNAAVMGLDGRRAEAASEHRAANAALLALGQRFDAAVIATEAMLLLPDRPELRAMADTARETLTRLGAIVWLERLDAALAAATPAPAASPGAPPPARVIADRGGV